MAGRKFQKSHTSPPPILPSGITGDLSRLDVNPGDILVLKVDRVMSVQETQDIKAHFMGILGPDIKLVVLGPNMNLSTIRKVAD